VTPAREVSTKRHAALWTKQRLAVVALVLLAFIWGYSWVASKEGLKYTDPFTFTAFRAGVAGVILLLLLPVFHRPLKPKALAWTALLGLLQTSGFAGLLIWALQTGGGAGKTSVLVYTMPFWLLLMAWLVLGERLVGLQWVAFVIALAGFVLILTPWQLRGVKSTLLATAAGLCWAAGTVVVKIINKRHPVDLLSLTAWQMVLGAVPLVIAAFLTSTRPTAWVAPFIFAVLYNIVIAGCVAWVLWLFVLRVLPAGKTGLASLAVPVVAVGLAWIQLHEKPPLVEAIGMGLVVAALALQAFWEMAWQSPRSRTRSEGDGTADKLKGSDTFAPPR